MYALPVVKLCFLKHRDNGVRGRSWLAGDELRNLRVWSLTSRSEVARSACEY
jgi:hypothetical protein